MNNNLEKYIILISFISSVIGVFVINGVIIAIPEISSEFEMNNIIQNWIPTIFVFIVTILTIPAGQLSSKIGFKKSLIIGNTIKLLGFIGIIFAFSAESFLLFRLFQGIGVAFANISEIAIITLGIPKKNRGKALGITVTGVYVGTSVAPVISGFLVQYFGWRSIFWIMIPFLILCILLMIFKLDIEWKNDDIKIDKIGSFLYMIGISLFIYGFTKLLTFTGRISVFIGICFIIIFVLYELKQTSPVFNVKLFKNISFTSYNITTLLGFFAVMVFTTILNYHFQYVRGWDESSTGLILIISPLIMSIVAINAGRLSDKYHPQKIATIGMFIVSFAFITISMLNKDTSLYIIVIAMILQAIGMGLFSSPNLNAIMSSVPKKEVSNASSTQLTMRAIGQTMSLALLTLVFTWMMGDLPIISQYADMIVNASQIISIVCAFASILAVIISVIGIKFEEKSSC